MQIVGYETAPGVLVLAEDGNPEPVPLRPGRELAYTLGERRCAGIVEDGRHRSCDRSLAPRCRTHASTWVCARCTGTCLKDEMDCHQEHAVYLAAFAPDTFKVGVTRLGRLETRLREQGADRAAHIRTVSNGRIAREIEADIATDVPDRVRVPTKVAGLHRRIDEDAWRDLLEDFDVIDTYSFDYGLDLASRPVHETIATGRVRGTKGRVLVVAGPGGSYAVDLRTLVGHELREGATSRDLQAELGTFG